MTNRAFLFKTPLDANALERTVGAFFKARTMVYENVYDIGDLPPVGRLAAAYRAAAVRVFLSPFDPAQPGTLGWFSIETARIEDNAFEDRPLARVLAMQLGQEIVFRDPTPDPRDTPYTEAAQIGIAPNGEETELWLVEYGTEAGEVAELLKRSEI